MNLAAARRVLANRSVLLALLGYVVFSLVLHSAWLAAIIYAFNRGGASVAGTVAVGVLGPAAVAAPFVAVWFDRLSANFALAAGFALQAVWLGAVAVSVTVGAPSIVTYILFGIFSIAQMASRPTLSAILPRIVHEPSELTAANSATSTAETIGLVLGPALTGLLIVRFDSEATTFFVCAIAMIVAALLAMMIDSQETAETHEMAKMADVDEPSTNAGVIDGIRLLRREPGPRQLVLTMAAMRLIVGALKVGVVIIAVDHLGKTEASAGLLGAALGFGALLGAVVSFMLVGRRRLSLPLSLGVAAASLPVALIAFTDVPIVVLGLLALAGLGRPLVDVSGRTLLQGLSTNDTLAQVFGLLEGLSLLILAAGSAGFSFLALATSVPAALLVTGVLPCAFVAMQFEELRRIDHGRPEIDPELVALCRTTPIFAPLAAFRLEQILLNMRRAHIPPGAVVFSEGDEGDDFHLVADGTALISLDTGEVEIGRGGFFGEIALLRDQPRMATVRAGGEGLATYTLSREVFLGAIATAPQSRRRTHRIVGQRLREF